MMQRHTIDTIVGPLAVHVVGDGPTAVLWPSLFMDGRSWDRVLPALAQDRRLVVVDGPGHGASGDPGHRYALRDCMTAAGQVLDRLSVTDPVDWVGNAWGGHVGLRFAADRPSQCRTLVTLGTPVAALSRSERRRTYPLLAVFGLLGPIELVLSGVAEAMLSDHTRARPRPRSRRRYREVFDALDEAFCVIEMILDDEGVARRLPLRRGQPRLRGPHRPARRRRQDGPRDAAGHRAPGSRPTRGRPQRRADPLRRRGRALRRWFDVYAWPLGRPASRRVAVHFTDITERKLARTSSATGASSSTRSWSRRRSASTSSTPTSASSR
jgi:pimeloyl-ACP methyl ester carboxylesterase